MAAALSQWIQLNKNSSVDVTSNVFTFTHDDSFLAFVSSLPKKTCDITVYDLQDKSQSKLTLAGHRSSPYLLKCGNSTEPYVLISTAEDYIIKWNLTECLINQHNNADIRGSVVMQTPRDGVSYISYDSTDARIAICTGYDVIVHCLESNKQLHALSGHTDRITCAEFCPHYSSTLVTTACDRTFKIWNIESQELIYSSCIMSSSVPEHLVMLTDLEEFILASEDGMVRFFDISEDSKFIQLRSLDVDKVLHKFTFDKEGAGDAGFSSVILALVPCRLSLTSEEDDIDKFNAVNERVMKLLFGAVDLLVIVTSSHLLLVNINTVEVLAIQPHADDLGCISQVSCAISSAHDEGSEEDSSLGYPNDIIKMAATRMSSHSVVIMDVDLMKGYMNSQNQDLTHSVISRVPVLSNSPLRSSLVPKQPKPKKKTSHRSRFAAPLKKGVIQDKPVLNKTKIKSSGYSTTQQKRSLFQPIISQKKSLPQTPKSGIRRSINEKMYPANADPISKLKGQKITIDTRPTHIISSSFSSDGQRLCTACANSTAYSFRLPLSNRSITHSGHTGVVHSCSWSYSNEYLTTASNDSTVKLWSKDGTHEMTIDNKIGNLATDKGQNQKTLQEVVCSQFYYVDKFILAASGDSILMYKYHIDKTKNDIERYKNGSRYKLAAQFQLLSALKVTSMTAAYSFYSYIVLATGSDKSIQIVDMNRQTQYRIAEECHTKAPYLIKQLQGSLYSTLSQSAYDLCLTGACGDGIKLWDVRNSSCVRRFQSHVCKAVACGFDVSPDGKYLATGSEDNSVYIYDVSSGKQVKRISGLSDTVTSICYHPLYPQIAVGTLNGELSIYEA